MTEKEFMGTQSDQQDRTREQSHEENEHHDETRIVDDPEDKQSDLDVPGGKGLVKEHQD